MTNKPPRIWIITDTHFNHDAMVHLCGRPENHTQLILENWRKSVTDNDITFHLGDVIFNRPSELESMIRSVPGRKILVMGNHDRNPPQWYMRRGFEFACQSFVYNNVLFSHHPAQSLPDGASFNIHGHYHNSDHHRHEFEFRPWHKLLAIELTNYKPVLLTDLR